MKTALWLAIASTTFLSSVANAESIAGDVHLALEGNLLSFDRGTTEADALDFEEDSQALEFGFPTGASARVGFAASDALELGIVAGFSRTNNKDGSGDTRDEYSESDHSVAAYLRYVAPGNSARFFIGSLLGGAFQKTDDPGEQGDDGFEASGRTFVIGADAGLYGFLAQAFSLDPFLRFTYAVGSLEYDDDVETTELDLSGFQISLGLSISGWVATR